LSKLRIAHPADLDAETPRRRALLCAVFADDMTEHDREHALRGLHTGAGRRGADRARVRDPTVGRARRALRSVYAEDVGVRADRRRRH
jgi:hypothetical protein